MPTPQTAAAVTYPCAQCGANNRIPTARLREQPKCGRCGETVFPNRPIVVTEGSFAQDVEQSPLPVLVDCWAPWCGPCLAVAPVLEQIAAERQGQWIIAKVNTDECPSLARRFDISAIPTLLKFSGGKLVDRQAGAVPKAPLLRWMDK